MQKINNFQLFKNANSFINIFSFVFLFFQKKKIFFFPDLTAGQEAHVYKYADQSDLYYQCQISITIKEPGDECSRPQCSEPEGFGAVKSGAAPAPEALAIAPRLLKKRSINYDNTMDVRTTFSAIDITDEVCFVFCFFFYFHKMII